MTASAAAGAAPFDEPLATRHDFHAAVRTALDAMVRDGAREAWFVDEDFDDWPLGERDVVDALARWIGPQRSLHLVARGYDTLVRRHPRWIAWRTPWAHRVECLALDDLPRLELPALLLVPACLSVQLADRGSQRGVLSRDPAQWQRQREWVDAVSQHCVPALPATLLGL